MLSHEEENLIFHWHKGLPSVIPITCNTSDDHRTGLFESFCDGLSRPSPMVVVTRRRTDEAEEPPSIEVHKRLIYHAIPEGPELGPFLDALSHVSDGPTSFHSPVGTRLKNLKSPCFLKLFIAPECPFCPKMVQDLAPLALTDERVKLTVIDGTLFPEIAEAQGVKSAPTLLLDDRLRWTGQTPLEEILDVMTNQDPSLLSAASIESLLGDGRAGMLAEMMVTEGKIFPAFIDMLIHEKWPVRLGAMVAMEEIVERDKGLAEQWVEPLWERFHGLNKQVQGDVIYVLGQSGTRDVIPRLKGVLSGSSGVETKEAAMEAIQAITQRNETRGEEG